jgi:hypothetical protein
MRKEFKDLEATFEELRRQFRRKDISRQEFIEQLKELRLQDDEGHFWMIGAQSGKWYYYDGKNWIRSDPPSLEEGKAICIHCGYENELTAEVCVSCGGQLGKSERNYCSKCGTRLEDPSEPCPHCSQEPEVLPGERLDEGRSRANFVFHRLSPLSFLFFWGTAGLLVGVVLGAFAGASEYFFPNATLMPGFLKDVHGNLWGAIVFALLGGVAGALVFGVLGFLQALVINGIVSLVGGIKIFLERR